MNAKNRCFVLLKPLGYQFFKDRLLSALQDVGNVARTKEVLITPELITVHYEEFSHRPELMERFRSVYGGKVGLAVELHGDENIVPTIRELIGHPAPAKCREDQLRSWTMELENWREVSEDMDNLIHASNSPEATAREIKLWFGDEGAE